MNFDDLTDEQLLRAVCLMVRPEWLREREVLAAILQALASKQPLHDGPYLAL